MVKVYIVFDLMSAMSRPESIIVGNLSFVL